MRQRNLRTQFLAYAFAFGNLTACSANTEASSQSNEEQEWVFGEDEASDGTVRAPMAISLEEAKRGNIRAKTQADHWGLELNAGTDISVAVTRRSGNLRSYITIYNARGSRVATEFVSLTQTTLVRSFRVPADGKYRITIGADQKKTTGNYEILLSCAGNRCARSLELEERSACLNEAARCALPLVLGEGTDPSRAFDDCLASASVRGLDASCSSACVGFEDYCNEYKAAFTPHRAKGASCFGVVSDVFDSCMHRQSPLREDLEAMEDGSPYKCWVGIWNGSALGYAREIDVCGGTVVSDTYEACMLECESTIGAHYDDIQDLCEHCADEYEPSEN